MHIKNNYIYIFMLKTCINKNVLRKDDKEISHNIKLI